MHNQLINLSKFGSNGVVHGIQTLLVPPINVLERISFTHDEYSQFKHGLTITGLDDVLQHSERVGGTFFAPSNAAFARLGSKINDFLYNNNEGLKYLRALLSYHMVFDHTLYSDAYWNVSVTPEFYIEFPQVRV